ncbi:MAG: HAMP domain-containing sensor histidine kinase [Chitinophagales bacterium]
MNIYEQKNTWKLILLIALLLIIITSILYTNFLAGKLAREERKKMELLADVYKLLNATSGNVDLGFMFHIIESNETVPLILTDEAGNVIGHKNLDSLKTERDTNYLKQQLLLMKADRPPIDIEYSKNAHQYIYYRDSYLLVQLRYFPFIQFSIILLFLAVAYLTFSTARRAEQNRVWAGMAKETAHQLGTPISALSGWVDYMKLQLDEGDETWKVLPEVEKDIERLELIAERFSKIGSIPDLVTTNLYDEVEKSTQYIRRRASGKVLINLHAPQGKNVEAMISPPLFAWVIENLLKNALDAIGGSGNIDIYVQKQGKQTFLDIKDSGKGIPQGKFKEVFLPGYSTKKRGWGLGLSLAKRIVEEFHKGKIFVKESQMGKGTTFRIALRS